MRTVSLAIAAALRWWLPALLALLSGGLPNHCLAQADAALAPAPGLQMLRIKPSDADPAVQAFDEPHVVMLPRDVAPATPLVVFFPGTNGRPDNVRLLLGVIALQGFPVIGLEYDNEPAVVQVCPNSPQPGCSAAFRQQRTFGNADGAPVDNPLQETIVRRLVMLLRRLHQQQPDAGSDAYLDGDAPKWPRIVVSGLSQGAGMAAFIAKQKPVARVVLFSSPWDFYGPRRMLAPWLAEPSATPPERWFAAFHRRENTAALIARAYTMLAIPAEHIRVLDADLPNASRSLNGGINGGISSGINSSANSGGNGPNPFHGSTVRLPVYVPDWQWLFGQAAAAR